TWRTLQSTRSAAIVWTRGASWWPFLQVEAPRPVGFGAGRGPQVKRDLDMRMLRCLAQSADQRGSAPLDTRHCRRLSSISAGQRPRIRVQVRLLLRNARYWFQPGVPHDGYLADFLMR